MGRIVLVAGPLYVDFTTAVTHPASAEYQTVLQPEKHHETGHWTRELGGSAWKVAAFWKKQYSEDELILVMRVAQPWSEEQNFREHKDRPFVDDGRWMKEELIEEEKRGLSGVSVISVPADKPVDYTFHLKRENVEWPIQTVWGGAAHELSSQDIRRALQERVVPQLKKSPRAQVLVVLCGIARTRIFEELIREPTALDDLLPGHSQPKVVIDFGRLDLREREATEKGRQELAKLRQFVARADLAFVDEPTAGALDLLHPENLPRQGLIVRHRMSGIWWNYRKFVPANMAASRAGLERRPLLPFADPQDSSARRPHRFARIVAAWNWDTGGIPSKTKAEWQQYRRIDTYNDPANITSDEDLLAQLKAIEESATSGRITKLLIYGETGTGKEIIARWVHRLLWKRKGHGEIKELPYVVIPPGGSDEIAQSMLFGHVKGAFTGAESDAKGAFERAQGGVLLLDDLQKISPRVQMLMLGALEYGRIAKVGSQETNSLSEGGSELDVFLVCTVNERPEELIRGGKLLKDLFYRLLRDGPCLELSPLRDRSDDALRAAEEMWQDLARRDGEMAPELPESLRKAIRSGRLEGNFRTIHSIVHQQNMIDFLKRKGHSTELHEKQLAQMINDDSTAIGGNPGDKEKEQKLAPSFCHQWIRDHRAELEQEWRAQHGDRELNNFDSMLEWIWWSSRRCYEVTKERIFLQQQHFKDLMGQRFWDQTEFGNAMNSEQRQGQWQRAKRNPDGSKEPDDSTITGRGAGYTLRSTSSES